MTFAKEFFHNKEEYIGKSCKFVIICKRQLEFSLEIGILAYSSEGVPQIIFILKGKSIMFMLFAPQEKGQGLVEYAIIIALIAIVVIAVVTTLGKKVNNTFNNIGNSLTF